MPGRALRGVTEQLLDSQSCLGLLPLPLTYDAGVQ